MKGTTIHNYFRHWKKATNIDSQRYKIKKAQQIFKRLQQTIVNCKINYFYKWVVISKYDDNDNQEQVFKQ